VAVEVTGGHFRLASPATANVVGIAGLVLFLASGPLEFMARTWTVSNAGPGTVLLLAFGGVGWVVAQAPAAQPVGWLLFGFAVLLAVGGCAGPHAVLVYRLGQGTLPFGPVALLLELLWAPVLALFPLSILLFPDGTLPSPRWRGVLAAYLVIGASWPVSICTVVIATIAGHHIQVDTSGNLMVVVQLTGSAAWLTPAQEVILPVLAVFWLLFIGGQVASFRRSPGERRQQLKWLLCGGVACLLGIAVDTLLGTLAHPMTIAQAAIVIGEVMIIAFPLGIGWAS